MLLSVLALDTLCRLVAPHFTKPKFGFDQLVPLAEVAVHITPSRPLEPARCLPSKCGSYAAVLSRVQNEWPVPVTAQVQRLSVDRFLDRRQILNS